MSNDLVWFRAYQARSDECNRLRLANRRLVVALVLFAIASSLLVAQALS